MSGRRLAWLLVALLLAANALVLYRAGRLWRGSQLIAAVERDVRRAGMASGVVRARLVQRNLERLREADELVPAAVAVPLLEGGQYRMIGRHRAAVVAYRRALLLEPRAEIYLNLARSHLALGERRRAERALRTAAALDRNLVPRVRALRDAERAREKTR